MGYRRGYYRKDGTYVQGHFVSRTNKSRLSMRRKGKSGCLVTFLFLFTLAMALSCISDSVCATNKCSDFSSQAEAQAVFNSDPQCNKNLDADNDKIACENLSN